MEKIFSPEESHELLRGWQIHIRKSWKKHEAAARRLETQYRFVGAASVVFSVVVGASIFASLEKEYEPWGRVIVGLVSLLASVLSSLITFNRYEERTEKHRTVAARYKAGLRKLEQTLAASNSTTIDLMRQELDELETLAPVVPENINSRIDESYKDYSFVSKASDLARHHEKRAEDELPVQPPPSSAA